MDQSEPTRDEYRVKHDWDGDASVTQTIGEGIAAMTGIDPSETAQLDSSVDADALERLFALPDEPASEDEDGRVTFSHDGLDVEVTRRGVVTIRRRGQERDGSEITTASAFRAELARLIRTAEANGVTVEGGWACRDESEYPEWGIEIYEVR